MTVSDPVQLFDILPTFLALAGIDNWLCNTTNVTGYVQFGSSLLPWAEGGTPSPAGVHSYVYAEAGYYWANEVEYNDPTQNATWTDPHQLYYPRGQEEHYSPSHSVRLIAMRNATHKLVYRARGQVRESAPSFKTRLCVHRPCVSERGIDVFYSNPFALCLASPFFLLTLAGRPK